MLPRVGITPQPVRIAQAADPIERSRVARPVPVVERKIAGVPIRLVTIDLTDPQTFINIGLQTRQSGKCARSTRGDEAFDLLFSGEAGIALRSPPAELSLAWMSRSASWAIWLPLVAF
ncbi:hypothetical protein Q2T42_30980 [Leptolyngbya boryana CZ1]|uniref:Uncharacterized protein n=1 Tax=Leptolyngbya boryana CZ1 TaxID=3060204 RepID=A0AA96WUW7_LEPBY|nr:hypothetical protein [Leptolyngbya boryana]WNZ46215.1 hypothetical protein Q2T42_30980 [Leptolyngbya boryana CZ1]